MRSAWVLTLAFLAGGTAAGSEGTDMFEDVLRADGPLPERAGEMKLYEALLGDWEMEVFDYADDGTRRTSSGEWHFAWVLEGRAIQDVFIAPARASRRPGQPPKGNRYGATLRVYDPAAGVWHVTWINPVSGAHDTLVGRRRGDEIVQEGKDRNGSPIRWIFSEVTPTSFRWRGERSTDGGKTWRLEAEFFGRRAGATRSP